MPGDSFYFNPSAKGIAVFLGPTEAAIMELAWVTEKLTVKQALYNVTLPGKPKYTTIMTVMSRLADKGLLKRQKEGRLFSYRAVMSREEFLRQRMATIHNCLKEFR